MVSSSTTNGRPLGCAVLFAALLLLQCGKDEARGESRGEGSPIKNSESNTTAKPSPGEAESRKIPAAVVFDRKARLEFADDPKDPMFNFFSTGTIDLLFCPSEATGALAKDDAQFHQALLCCSDGEEDATRYGIFLLGDLDGIGFWNGKNWWRVDHDFEANAWVHLTVTFQRGWVTMSVNGRPIDVVRAPIGLPLDPADPEESKLRFCKLHVGGTSSGRDSFLGRIAWVRTWRAALSMEDVARLPSIVGVPEDPALAQSLAATSAFTETDQSLRRSSISTRSAIGEKARAAKRGQAFAKVVPWLFDLEKAKKEAAGSGRRILAWCTRGDAYDPACLAIEKGLPWEDLWGALKDKFVPLLLVGSTTDPEPAGVPTGSGALIDAQGKVLRRMVPWTAEFVLALDQDITKHAASSGPEARARSLLLQSPVAMSTGQLAELQRLAAGGKLPGELVTRIQDAEQVARIVALQTRFRDGEKLGPKGGEPLPFERAQFHYNSLALELFAALKLPLEPDPRLADFAILLWRGVVENPRLDVATDAVNFLVPMRSLDPALDAAVGALPLALNFGTEAKQLDKLLQGK